MASTTGVRAASPARTRLRAEGRAGGHGNRPAGVGHARPQRHLGRPAERQRLVQRREVGRHRPQPGVDRRHQAQHDLVLVGGDLAQPRHLDRDVDRPAELDERPPPQRHLVLVGHAHGHDPHAGNAGVDRLDGHAGHAGAQLDQVGAVVRRALGEQRHGVAPRQRLDHRGEHGGVRGRAVVVLAPVDRDDAGQCQEGSGRQHPPQRRLGQEPGQAAERGHQQHRVDEAIEVAGGHDDRPVQVAGPDHLDRAEEAAAHDPGHREDHLVAHRDTPFGARGRPARHRRMLPCPDASCEAASMTRGDGVGGRSARWWR
jgi:hypothetical protein